VRARHWGTAVLLGLAVVAGAVLLVVRPWHKSSTEVVRLTVGGRERSYLAVVPRHRDARANLVVFLPGLGMSADEGRADTKLDVQGVKQGAVVVYAQGVNRSWNAGGCCGGARTQGVDDVAFLSALIADARSRFDVIPARADLVGFSNGALMASRFACERPGDVQALVVASGAALARRCDTSRPVTVMLMHGELDLVDPYAGGTSAALGGYVAPPVADVAVAAARSNGCTGKPKVLKRTSQVTGAMATGCPRGVYTLLWVSHTMKHHWATGESDTARFGFDETALTWTFLTATRG
jgi:polyhydroxybutyrate depolymerase